MAAPNPERTLQDEATCSICLDYFQDPVMVIDCGHSFCRACITQCCEGSAVEVLPCPQCRKPFPWQNLPSNRHLWSIVELAKQFSKRQANETGEQKLCQKHLEPLKLFCEDDQTPICVVCDRSMAHKNHSVAPIEEAAQIYQAKLHDCLKLLKEEREKILALKLDVEKPSQDLLKDAAAERQKLISEFEQLHQFLKKQEQRLLAHLEAMEKEVEKKRDENTAKFSEEISHLGALIQELEQKCQEPPCGLLQDIGNTMNRCQRAQFQPPVERDSSELRRKLQIFSKESASLQADLKNFQVSFPDFSPFIPLETRSQPKWMEVCFPDFSPFIPLETRSQPKWMEENVVLDRGTAHPRFVVSDDRKSVSWGSFRQEVPYSPKRFDPSRCVLGSRGFSSGRHHWTVDVEHGTFWAVGVAQASVQRKGQLQLVPEEGIWAVGLHNGQYKALTSPPDLLILDSRINKVQICLDYAGATVAFWDDEEGYELYCFRSANFEGQTLFPFFRVGDMRTTLSLC